MMDSSGPSLCLKKMSVFACYGLFVLMNMYMVHVEYLGDE